MKHLIEESHVVAEPREWFFGQLRFNMTRPFVAELYTIKSKELKHRYDVIKSYMATEVPRLRKVLDQDGYAIDEMVLASKPGSATSNDGFGYIENIINTAYKNGHSGMDLPRDWYCYWLQPLLLCRDAYTRSVVENLSDANAAMEIYSAVEPFMKHQSFNDKTVDNVKRSGQHRGGGSTIAADPYSNSQPQSLQFRSVRKHETKTRTLPHASYVRGRSSHTGPENAGSSAGTRSMCSLHPLLSPQYPLTPPESWRICSYCDNCVSGGRGAQQNTRAKTRRKNGSFRGGTKGSGNARGVSRL